MRRVFVDTSFWIALLNPRDQNHASARARASGPAEFRWITSEEVLSELLTFFSGFGPIMRQTVASFVIGLLSDPEILVLPQSHQTFTDALALYQTRLDKGYSLTDCASMTSMRREALDEALTADAHFAQEGFRILLG